MRYIFNSNIHIRETLMFDVVIVGTGLAGLYTALNIDEEYSVALLSKEGVGISNSWLAQGGIAAAISTDDQPAFHLEDTLIAGAGLCKHEAVKLLVDEGPSDIRRLVSWNVPFDLNAEGDLSITREGGHRRNRIVHAGGDATGRETVLTLARIAALRDNISFFGHSFFVDIISDDNGAVAGLLACDIADDYRLIRTNKLVICTGGVGQVYKASTNPSVATGDGIAAAMRAGAKLKDIEFIQFHPTGLWTPEKKGRCFLVSEAVRGEGGVLRNADGVRFMEGTHELNELAPRDIVARAIVEEMDKGGSDHVFLDITSRDEKFLSKRFPTIYNECLSRGLNIARDLIPVCPVQHYLIGGIETDLDARTCVPGLYACGEAASTGVHGANRLASNSMLECLVFGRKAAEHINKALAVLPDAGNSGLRLPGVPTRPSRELDLSTTRARIQLIMDSCGSVVRTRDGLSAALSEIEDILLRLESVFGDCREYAETLNIATVAKAILEGALSRSESVGAHFRLN